MGIAAPKALLRFGVFELDPNTQELRKSGKGIKLRPQAAKTLAVLASRAGQLVTREELQQELWDQETFVDFDHSINLCIREIRVALGDDAITPRYIETVPRQGYRFIASLSELPSAPSTDQKPRRYYWLVAAFAAGVLTLVGGLAILHTNKWWTRLWVGNARSIRSIVVLPLQNLSNDPSQQYFADGMTDELITDLAQIGGMRVISRTSSMQYRDTKKTMLQIGRELDAGGVIEGTVERVGDHVRIRVQMIEALSDRHLWAKSYERSLSDILAMQEEVARNIAGEIQVALTPQEQERLTDAPAVNSQAHDAVMRGLYYDNQGEIQKAIDSFRQATAISPDYAAAHADLAQSYIELGNDSILSPKAAYSKAKSEASRAIELDGNLAEAHQALAELLHYYDWNFPSAEREYQRALELAPGSAPLLSKYAFFLCRTGKHDDAVRLSKRAQDLDPLSLVIRTSLGVVLHYSRRYDEAMAQYRKVLALSSKDTTEARFQLARLYATKRMFPAAFAELDKMLATNPSDSNLRSMLAMTYAFEGRREESLRIVHSLEKKRRLEYLRPYILAEDYAALGNNDKAMEWLERAYKERDDWIAWIKVDPNLDGLRSEPRFGDLLRRVGLPQ